MLNTKYSHDSLISKRLEPFQSCGLRGKGPQHRPVRRLRRHRAEKSGHRIRKFSRMRDPDRPRPRGLEPRDPLLRPHPVGHRVVPPDLCLHPPERIFPADPPIRLADQEVDRIQSSGCELVDQSGPHPINNFQRKILLYCGL